MHTTQSFLVIFVACSTRSNQLLSFPDILMAVTKQSSTAPRTTVTPRFLAASDRIGIESAAVGFVKLFTQSIIRPILTSVPVLYAHIFKIIQGEWEAFRASSRVFRPVMFRMSSNLSLLNWWPINNLDKFLASPLGHPLQSYSLGHETKSSHDRPCPYSIYQGCWL